MFCHAVTKSNTERSIVRHCQPCDRQTPPGELMADVRDSLAATLALLNFAVSAAFLRSIQCDRNLK